MSGRLPVACGQVPSRATQPSGACTEGPCVPRSRGLALALPLPTLAVRGNEARPSFSPTQLGKGPGPLTHVPLQMTGFSFRQTQASPDAGQTAVHGAFAHRHVPALITAGPGPSSPRHGGTRGFSARDTVPAADEDDARPPTPPLPPEWAGGPHSSTIPWPWRADTVLLALVLKFSRSVGRNEKRKGFKRRVPKHYRGVPRGRKSFWGTLQENPAWSASSRDAGLWLSILCHQCPCRYSVYPIDTALDTVYSIFCM